MSHTFFEFLKKNYNINLNDQQKQAVLHQSGPALILAVPGSGKTTALICRTAYLILKHNITPDHILSITFSRASAKDMKKRFYELFSPFVKIPVYFSTIHRLSLKIIQRYAKFTNQSYTIIEGKKGPLSKNVLLRQIYQKYYHDLLSEETLDELHRWIGFVKNMMISPKEFVTLDIDLPFFKEIYSDYESYKQENHLIDFDDMLCLCLHALKTCPGLLKLYQKQYPYIQVDEAQDTSKVQHEIIKLLASPSNNVFMVADDDQSIYGFRGAYPEALLNFKDVFSNSKIYYLETNYRSSQDIVNMSNELIKINQKRYEKSMRTPNPNYAPIEILKSKNLMDQINFLLEEISNHKGTLAILYRNNLSAVSLIHMLKENNISFSVQGFKSNFFYHWMIKDFLAFFNLALNPYDLESFERIYYKMNGFISKSAIIKIKHDLSSRTIFDRLLDLPDLKSYQKKNLRRLRNDFYDLSHKKPQDAISSILNGLAYSKYIKSNCKRNEYSYTNTLFLLEQFKIIASTTDSILELLGKFETLKHDIFTSISDPTASIILSTMHSSKGLEFDHVYLIDLIEGQFPSKVDPEKEDMTALEEERRLFYVGMTRAKKRLTLIIPTFLNGSYQTPSPFVKEVEKLMPSKTTKIGNTMFKKSYKKDIKKQINDQDHSFVVGMPVIHKKFGHGTIQSICEDTLTINFKDSGIRGLSLSICIRENLLSTAL